MRGGSKDGRWQYSTESLGTPTGTGRIHPFSPEGEFWIRGDRGEPGFSGVPRMAPMGRIAEVIVDDLGFAWAKFWLA